MSLIFDSAKALEQIGGDKEFCIELVRAFLEDTQKLVDEIDVAVDQRDTDTIRRAAHTIKGSADFLAASTTRSLALSLEKLGRDREWDEIPTAIASLKEALARLEPELRTFLDS